MKLSRRDFLKSITALGAISPFFNIELIKANDFTSEQLEALKEVERIEDAPPSPYFIADPYEYYQVILKNGEYFYCTKKEVVQKYGSVLNCITDKSVSTAYPVSRPANWND